MENIFKNSSIFHFPVPFNFYFDSASFSGLQLFSNQCKQKWKQISRPIKSIAGRWISLVSSLSFKQFKLAVTSKNDRHWKVCAAKSCGTKSDYADPFDCDASVRVHYIRRPEAQETSLLSRCCSQCVIHSVQLYAGINHFKVCVVCQQINFRSIEFFPCKSSSICSKISATSTKSLKTPPRLCCLLLHPSGWLTSTGIGCDMWTLSRTLMVNWKKSWNPVMKT